MSKPIVDELVTACVEALCEFESIKLAGHRVFPNVINQIEKAVYNATGEPFPGSEDRIKHWKENGFL